MAMQNALQNFAAAPLLPKVGKKVVELAINLAPNSTFAKGTVLGQITSAANDVQTVTISGSPTGGTFTLSGTNPLTGQAFTTSGIAYNAASSAVQTALTASTAFGTGNVTVSGSAGGPYTVTAAGSLVSMPIPVMTAASSFTGGTSPATAVAHTTTGRTAATYAAYASGNSDGTQVPKCLLKFDCATDAAGNITYGSSAIGGPWGETYISTPAYFSGYFDTSQLTGLDSNAVAASVGFAKLISGTVSSGLVDVF